MCLTHFQHGSLYKTKNTTEKSFSMKPTSFSFKPRKSLLFSMDHPVVALHGNEQNNVMQGQCQILLQHYGHETWLFCHQNIVSVKYIAVFTFYITFHVYSVSLLFFMPLCCLLVEAAVAFVYLRLASFSNVCLVGFRTCGFYFCVILFHFIFLYHFGQKFYDDSTPFIAKLVLYCSTLDLISIFAFSAYSYCTIIIVSKKKNIFWRTDLLFCPCDPSLIFLKQFIPCFQIHPVGSSVLCENCHGETKETMSSLIHTKTCTYIKEISCSNMWLRWYDISQ